MILTPFGLPGIHQLIWHLKREVLKLLVREESHASNPARLTVLAPSVKMTTSKLAVPKESPCQRPAPKGPKTRAARHAVQ
eukprot:2066180-Amphidinium_carterae.2